jgi:hypothetical protein
VTGEPVSTEGPAAASRPRWLWPVVAVAGVLVVALLVWWALGRGDEPTAATPGVSPTATPDPSEQAAEPTAGTEPTEPAPSDTPGAVPGGEAPGAAAVPEDVQRAVGERAVQPPVPFTAEAPLGPADATEVVVRVTALEAVEGTAQGPGEVGGPALRATVQIENRTAETLPLISTVVNLTFGPDNTPAIGLSGPGAASFPQEVAAGQTATGVFVFNVPVDQRDLVRVWVDYRLEVPVVVFEGPGPTG